MPTRDRYDPARDIFTSDPDPAPPPAAAAAPRQATPSPKVSTDPQSSPPAPPRRPANSPTPTATTTATPKTPNTTANTTSKPIKTPSKMSQPASSPQAHDSVPPSSISPSRKRKSSPSPHRNNNNNNNGEPVPLDTENPPKPKRRREDSSQASPAPVSRTRDGVPPSSSVSPSRKRKASPPPHRNDNNNSQPVPLNAENLPKIKRRRQDGSQAAPVPVSRRREREYDNRDSRDRHGNHHNNRDSGSSFNSRYRYHSPPPPIIPRAPPRDEDPAPAPRPRSPPRVRKRPGVASRFTDKEKEEHRLNLEKLEQQERARQAGISTVPERVEEVVRSHYNDKKELGKQWRQNSKIKGLRSFNNWVKSTLIQKFSPREDFDPRRPSMDPNDHLVVLDMGCGKGGDLLKWNSAPQEVGFYLGVDTADVSIAHARNRYDSMISDQRSRGRTRRNDRPIFRAEFHAMDCWVHPLDSIPIARRIGFDPNVGPGSRANPRFSSAGFDVVSMMFCMHYAFETEAKCRHMLKNVSGSLRAGGKFIGTIPSSDVISMRVRGGDPRDTLPEDPEHGIQEWKNSIYRVPFAKPPPRSGTFRPPFGWEYNFFLEEAVDQVPEYVVPWEAFRGIAEDYGLELLYKKPFHDVWKDEKDQPELKRLSERMGVTRDGKFALGDDEWEACGE